MNAVDGAFLVGELLKEGEEVGSGVWGGVWGRVWVCFARERGEG